MHQIRKYLNMSWLNAYDSPVKNRTLNNLGGNFSTLFSPGPGKVLHAF